MAAKPFNSLDGISVGEPKFVVIAANSDITTNAITVLNAANLGAVGNLTITGGSPNYILSTNGFGAVAWVENQGNGINPSILENGNSNVVVANAGNITMTVSGFTDRVIVTQSGVNVAGTFRATGNANVANIGANSAVLTGNLMVSNL